MSPSPRAPDSPDLARLVSDGFDLRLVDGAAVVAVPFVDADGTVRDGHLVVPLVLAGDVTAPPRPHTAFFAGGTPHDGAGARLKFVSDTSPRRMGGLTVTHMLSTKPRSGSYDDYHQLLSTYAIAISAHAEALAPHRTAQPLAVIDDVESPMRYHDTANARAGIDTTSMSGTRAVIIGLGGTGAHVLDLLAKLPLAEIRLYDDDVLLQHSALRGPGVVPVETLRERPKKVDYYMAVYSSVHGNIAPHDRRFTPEIADAVGDFDIAFVCIDSGTDRREIIEALLDQHIIVIDSGIGLLACDDGRLVGHIRTTLATPDARDHLDECLPHGDIDDEYGGNVQTAETNAMAAAAAVLRWKRLLRTYHDDIGELHSVMVVHGNEIINEAPSVIDLATLDRQPAS